jgi:hypothetical protein
MRLRKALVSAILLSVAATGCGSGHTAGPGDSSPQTSAAGQNYDAQERVNRAKAERDAALLLALVEVPEGSVELTTAPPSLPGPALGSTRSDTNVSLARYWRLPLSFPAADAYLKQHPPAGLSQWGTSSGGSLAKTRGYGWAGGGSGSPDGQLEIGLAAIGDGSPSGATSYLRVDALTSWMDPHPIADDSAGRRMRIEAGNRCPAESTGMVGVRNEGKDLNDNLAPADRPNAGLLCSYAGLNGILPLTLSLERVLTAADAARIAEAAHRVALSHYDAPHSCGMSDGSVTVLVLQYPSRPAVNLWLPSASCHGTSNGHIVATDLLSLGALRDVVNGLSR